MEEIQRTFYGDLGANSDSFAGWWNDVARSFEVPAELIRPTDRFGIELPYWSRFGITDEDLDLEFAARRRLKALRLPACRGPKVVMNTVDDYIRFMANCEAQARASS